MAADDGFLGRGWAFDLRGGGVGVDTERKHVAEAGGEEKIRQSIWLILSTARGERVGRPDFGCGIHDLVFSTPTAGALGDIARSVREALAQWEPRIEILAVDARVHPDDPNGVLVEIHYEILATNSRQNLVYPFYLSP